jgi:hypothetical protein
VSSRLNYFLFISYILILSTSSLSAKFDNVFYQDTTSDSSIADTTKPPSNTFTKVDVKVIFKWNPQEPERFENVKCQLILENKVIKELKVFFEDRTECYTIKKGQINYEIRDHIEYVEETEEAIHLIGQGLKRYNPKSVEWLLDKPVSNSGRLAAKIRNESQLNNYKWQIELINNPDRELINSEKIVISSDSILLDKVQKWANLSLYLINNYIQSVWLIDFGE